MKTKAILLFLIVSLQSALHLQERLQAQEISGAYNDAWKAGEGETIAVQDYCSFLNAEQAVDCRLQTTGSEKTANHSDRFLGTITASNLNDLYDGRMLGAFIMRTGLPGNYCYNLISNASTDRFNSCIAGLSWNDVAHYCDWKNSTSTFNLNSCGHASATVDPVLKSNLLTFRLVSTHANAYQAVGEEVVGTLEAIGDEELIGLASILFFGGMAVEGSGSALRGPGTHSVDLAENNRLASSERPNVSGSLLRESLLNASDPFGAASNPARSIGRQVSDSSKKTPSRERASNKKNSIPGSVVDSFVREHEGLFHAFEQLRSRSNSSDSDVERETSLLQHITPATPFTVRKNNNSLSEAERKSDGTDPASKNSNVRRLANSESILSSIPPSPPEKGPSLVVHDEKLPRTGLTVHECVSILKDFTDWRDKIGKHEGLQKKVEELAREVSWKSDAAAKYRLYPDQERVRARDLAIAEHAKAKREHDANIAKIKRLGDSLHKVSERLLPPSIPEKGDEQYPEFSLSEGVSLEHAKQTYRQRQHLLASENVPKIENYHLHSSSINNALIWPFLERQTMLNQRALFQNRGYWLDFSAPLKGPCYSFDQEELIHRANQAHSHFMESAIGYMTTALISVVSHVEGKAKKENFFKLPANRLAEEVKGNSLNLTVGYTKHSLISFIKESILSEKEVKERAANLTSQDQKKLEEEKKDAGRYLNWIFGTETKLTNNKVQTKRINASAPFTKKQFLTEQRNRHISGEWSYRFNDHNWKVVGRFDTQESVQPYVDLFHRQSIKAASLLDQYRIMMLPDEEMSREVTRLQELSPGEREAELFERAGIEDWKLPTTPEELHAYVLREKAKWDQKEEAKQKEEAIKKEEAMKASNDSDDTFHQRREERWREQDEKERRDKEIMKGNQQRFQQWNTLQGLHIVNRRLHGHF